MQATPAAAVAATPAPPVAPDAITGLATPERVRAFDLARGLAIVFMIGVHVLWHWGAPDTWTTPIGQVISFLGGPTAAPVFMFLMGASLAFSSRSSFSSLAVRGLWLVWLGYLLNFLRGVIPAYLGLSTGLVRDAGRTVVSAGTTTCLGVGPDTVERIDAVTGTLRLLS